MNFADRIRRLRTSLKLTTSQVAEIFGVDNHTVNKWLSGEHQPQPEFQRTMLRLETDNLAAISPFLHPDTIKAFREGRARAQ